MADKMHMNCDICQEFILVARLDIQVWRMACRVEDINWFFIKHSHDKGPEMMFSLRETERDNWIVRIG